ncbi:uncharacterized protein LOC144143534 [Haemaphysalis longicornis]
MPLRRCAVVGCKAREGDTEVHHRVPADGELRKSWLRRMGLSVSDKRKCVHVCGRHFAADAYQRSPELLKSVGFVSRVLLKRNAVPTLHLPTMQPDTVPSAVSSITSEESISSTQACHCTCHCHLARRPAATQTAAFQWAASTQTDQRQSTRNSVGTQTVKC